MRQLRHLRVIGLDGRLEQLRTDRQADNQNRVALNLRLVEIEAKAIHAGHAEAEILGQTARIEEMGEPGDDGDPDEADYEVD